MLPSLPFSEVLSFGGFESCNKQSFLANLGLFPLNVMHLIFKYFLVLLLFLVYFVPSPWLLGSCLPHQACILFCWDLASGSCPKCGGEYMLNREGMKGEGKEGAMQGSQSGKTLVLCNSLFSACIPIPPTHLLESKSVLILPCSHPFARHPC